MLTNKPIADQDALNGRKQSDHVFRKSAEVEAPSKAQTPSEAQAPSEVQAALDRQATLFRDLGLDDQEPQSGPRTNDFSDTSSNPYALLHDLNYDDDDDSESQSADEMAPSRPVVHTMMPAADSPFWTRYGNKLRVNGTVEEVCVIR